MLLLQHGKLVLKESGTRLENKSCSSVYFLLLKTWEMFVI
jgi:hypothetical protein